MKTFQSVFSHKYSSVNFDLAGGIALFHFSSPGQVLIDSCSIIDNTIVLVLIDLAADNFAFFVTVNINKTQYSKKYDSQSFHQLLNVNKTAGQIVIYSDSDERYSYKELKNGYAINVSSLY